MNGHDRIIQLIADSQVVTAASMDKLGELTRHQIIIQGQLVNLYLALLGRQTTTQLPKPISKPNNQREQAPCPQPSSSESQGRTEAT